MTEPHVLFLDHTGALGGAELYLLDVVRHRPERAHVVLLEPGPFADRLQEASVPHEILEAGEALLAVTRSGGAGAALRAVPAIVGMIVSLSRRARRFDVVFANSQKALVVGCVAAWLARRPLVWNLHDILTADHFSEFNRKIAVDLANRFARRIIVNSRATLEAFGASGGDVKKARIVYNGIDERPFLDVEEGQVHKYRRSLPGGSAFTVGVFGRLAPWKGQHVLLHALASLPDVHALVVGDALFGEEDYAASLQQLAARLGVAERVHFLGFRTDIPRLMKCCDVIVHTSVSPEPFGRVLVEGMMAGRPVIGADAGGAREVVENGASGLMVMPGDSSALSNAIRHLLEHPEGRKRLSVAGQERARELFTVSAMADVLWCEISLAGNNR